ncbi:helix-turn-helix domain-containing protein [Solihabitans fulvus]|uniref:helix-turn-helix domain-containing protein n=1 Tax=Solihabitans fulvus TaxID=1892852 RepID=UPI001CB76669|nr:helix-turn-helix transcriptional regulator [Solihabitans fulvus]
MNNALGDFLRARRERVTPADAGLPPGHGLRRVTGLRREEVAMLAGISAEYYLRLEQGRDRNPSAQVLEALAQVLQLDQEGTAYLLSLAARNRAANPIGPTNVSPRDSKRCSKSSTCPHSSSIGTAMSWPPTGWRGRCPQS